MMRGALLSVVAVCAGVAMAEEIPEAGQQLQRLSTLAQKASFQGTFVHSAGKHVETARIVRAYDGRSVRERVELDAPQREIIRSNDDVVLYLPHASLVRHESRASSRIFPGVLPDSLTALWQVYAPVKTGTDRVAGTPCVVYDIKPRDAYRLAHRLCVDPRSGLLLRSSALNEQGHAVDQFTFTHLQFGAPASSDSLAPKAGRDAAAWRVEYELQRPAEPESFGLQLKKLPPGFQLIKARRRHFSKKPEPVVHLVYSDGLAHVSVFVEQGAAETSEAPTERRHGDYVVVVRSVAQHVVTAVGLAPRDTVDWLARAVQPLRDAGR